MATVGSTNLNHSFHHFNIIQICIKKILWNSRVSSLKNYDLKTENCIYPFFGCFDQKMVSFILTYGRHSGYGSRSFWDNLMILFAKFSQRNCLYSCSIWLPSLHTAFVQYHVTFNKSFSFGPCLRKNISRLQISKLKSQIYWTWHLNSYIAW